MAKSSSTNPRSRNWFIVTYLRYDDIQAVMDAKAKYIKAYAYILHDRDNKEPHTHVVLRLSDSYQLSTVRNWFSGVDDKGELANTLLQVCSDPGSAYAYLIHKYDPDKYQYDPCERICSDPSYFEEDEPPTDITWEALEAILSGASLRELAKRYGRDFIFHYSQLKKLAEDIQRQENFDRYEQEEIEAEERQFALWEKIISRYPDKVNITLATNGRNLGVK